MSKFPRVPNCILLTLIHCCVYIGRIALLHSTEVSATSSDKNQEKKKQDEEREAILNGNLFKRNFGLQPGVKNFYNPKMSTSTRFQTCALIRNAFARVKFAGSTAAGARFTTLA